MPLIFEPGRLLVAEAGILVTRVIFAKQGATRRFLVVDAAMNEQKAKARAVCSTLSKRGQGCLVVAPGK